MKTCSRCKIEKEESSFGKSKQQKDGLFPYCYQCCREKSTEYRRNRGIKPIGRRGIEELPKSKRCTRCKIEKPTDEFRIRQEDGKYYYINSTCKKCDAELTRTYYEKHKNDEDFKRRNCERAKAYVEKNPDKVRLRKSTIEFKKNHCKLNKDSYHRMKEVIAAKMKLIRQTPEFKKKMKAYRDKNKDKIYQQEQITKRRYQVKNQEPLTDKYILNKMSIPLTELEKIKTVLPELIEVKREQIKLHRVIDKHRQIFSSPKTKSS